MFSTNIRKLDFSHQGLTEVPADIAWMKQLRVMDLSYNNITHIQDFDAAAYDAVFAGIGQNQLRMVGSDLIYGSNFGKIGF